MRIVKFLGYGLICGVCFIGGKTAVEYLLSVSSEEEVAQRMEEQSREVKAIIEENPDDPIAAMEVLRDRATTYLSEASVPGAAEKRARSMFVGAYLANVRVRKEFCDVRGIDISPFVEEYARLHRREWEVSLPVFQAGGLTIEDFLKVSRQSNESIMNTDMESIKNLLEIDTGTAVTFKDVCIFVRDYGTELAAELVISKANPDMYAQMNIPD